MPTIDFDAARRERLAGYDPVAFKLGGQKFTCKPAIPFENLLLVIENEAEVAIPDLYRHACGFISECLAVPKDRERWAKVLTNTAEPVEEPDVYAIMRKLVEVYGARPTSPSPAYSGGRRANGATSNGKRSAPSRTRAGSGR